MSIEHDIAAYLHFGYLPTVPQDWDTLPWANTLTIKQVGERDNLVEQGLLKLRSGFTHLESTLHVVPLSGGLDSRAILAFLLEAGLREKIVAVTFGIPRTFDYDIARHVAREAGVRHELIDLSDTPLTQNELDQTASELSNWTYLVDAVFNRRVCKRFGRNATYWSGFMGDPLAGSHLLSADSTTWEQAKHEFAKRNRYGFTAQLAPPAFVPEHTLPPEPLLPTDCLSYDEQLDFVVRQEACIRPLVLPVGYDYRSPFLSSEWVEFMLSVPRDLRVNESLYKAILVDAFPHLFSLPAKTNVGLPLNAPNWRFRLRTTRLGIEKTLNRIVPRAPWPTYPAINYLDFDRELRKNGSLRDLFSVNLRELTHLNAVPWLNVDALWQAHQKGRANHGFALRLLLGLSVFLQTDATELASHSNR